MIVVLMGVTGSGKTTLGLRLAGDLGWRFIDADDFRRPEGDNVGATGTIPELGGPAGTLHSEVAGALARGENIVLADAALTARRRNELQDAFTDVQFVHLKGGASLLRQRLRNRSGHFLGNDALRDQLATIEEPKDAIAIDVDERPGRIVERIRDALGI
jgi:gluconokinase